ncbi:MAG: PilZ domain-containing protein [Pyrinomonadaceae bacterium]
MLRELVSKFSRIVAERRASVRKRYSLPVKVCFAPVEKDPVKTATPCDEAFLSGETTDLSAEGLGFIVSAIRINEKYLVGQDRVLNLELDISGRKLRMRARGVRYERVAIHLSTERYLIGAQIVWMSEADEAAYAELIQRGQKSHQAAPSVVEAAAK